MIEVSIARDFTKTPGPRKKIYGKYSAEEFLEKVLIPNYEEAKEKNKTLFIDLDGTYGCSMTFLHEVFSQLVKRYEKQDVFRRIIIKSHESPHLVPTIYNIIQIEGSTTGTKLVIPVGYPEQFVFNIIGSSEDLIPISPVKIAALLRKNFDKSDEAKEIWNTVETMVKYLLSRNKSVVFDMNFNNKEEREKWAKIAEEHKAITKFYVFINDPDIDEANVFYKYGLSEDDARIVKIYPIVNQV